MYGWMVTMVLGRGGSRGKHLLLIITLAPNPVLSLYWECNRLGPDFAQHHW